MRIALSLVVLALCACTAQAKSPHERIMDEIENGISLPNGAYLLRDYARYYALDEKGRVWAVYALPGPPPSGHEICKDMDGAIPPEKWRTVPCPKDSPEGSYLPAGHRRWMSDPLAIPTTLDTLGCEQLTFTYDAARNTFVTKPECSNQYQIKAAEEAAKEQEAARERAKPH
jgi:hypothetical protein